MRLGLIGLLILVFIEIGSIVKMSHYVGGWATLVLLLAGFIFGLKLMRSQGLNALLKTAQGTAPGESPLAPLAGGIVKAFAGILLIIPGFVSDIFALIILLPAVRNSFARHLAKKGQFQGFAAGSFGSGGFGTGGFGKGFGGFGGANAANEGNVYEHDGSAQTHVQPNGTPSERLIQGQVIERKPNSRFDKK